MLNEKGIREYAYIVKIDTIVPMDADRLECARVGGWNCVVGKGEFQIGDLAVFFEIDSQLPDVEPFSSMEFLASKHFRIKSQKIRGVVSQGLLMPVAAFGDKLVGHNADDETKFVTAILGVTHIVDEDHKAKTSSVNGAKGRAQSVMARYPKFARSKVGRWCGKRLWIMNGLYWILGGRAWNRGKEWPTGKFAGVSKTDQERCLPGATKILTDQGWIQINKLVNQKLDVKVASMDINGEIVYKKILDYQKFNNDKSMITIRYPYSPDCGRTNALCCTEDHKIFTSRGYVEAKDLTLDDCVYMPVYTYGAEVLPVIYGMLLGDSHIAYDKRMNGKLRVVATNGEKQLDYLSYKYNIFNDGKIINAGYGSFGDKPSYHWFLEADAQISMNVRKDWFISGKKHITEGVCNKINEAGLAFWYMDDGCLTYRNEAKTAYWIRLSTQGFTFEENQILVNMLARFNVKAKINKDKLAKDGHQMYRIDISSTKESDNFLQLVAPYICDSMKYKLPSQFQNVELIPLKFVKKNILMPVPIISIEEGQTKNKNWGKSFKVVYDIEVEDTHNFIADNIVVHNCENLPWVLNDKSPYIVTEKCDGSSATYILARKGRRFEFYVCSRNVRMASPTQECYLGENFYWQMARKYDIEAKMRKYLATHPKCTFVCWQGEICGPSIQGNPHKLNATHLYLFHWTDSERGRISIVEAEKEWTEYGMEVVPIVNTTYTMPDDMETFKKSAEGCYSAKVCEGRADCAREGFVYYSVLKPEFSFKNVSREYLLRKEK